MVRQLQENTCGKTATEGCYIVVLHIGHCRGHTNYLNVLLSVNEEEWPSLCIDMCILLFPPAGQHLEEEEDVRRVPKQSINSRWVTNLQL